MNSLGKSARYALGLLWGVIVRSKIVVAVLVGVPVSLSALLVLAYDAQANVLSYGDLTGIFASSFPNPLMFGSLGAYSILDWGLTRLLGPVLGTNCAFFLSTTAPMVGIYAFLELFSKRKVLVLGVSIIFGTVIGVPFLYALTHGTPEFGLWFLFLFLSYRCLWFAWRGDHPLLYGALFGLMYGISLDQTVNLTEMDIAGLLISLPSTLGMTLFLASTSNPRRWFWKTSVIATSALSTAITMIPVLLVALFTERGLNATRSSTIHAYVLPNVSFTFGHYGPASALFNSFPEIVNGVWLPDTSAWLLIVLGCMAGAFIGVRSGGHDKRWLSALFLFNYVFFGLLIVGISTNELTWVYSSVTVVDVLDYPTFFLWGELISMPFLFLVALDSFCVSLEHFPTHIRVGLNRGALEKSGKRRVRVAATLTTRRLNPTFVTFGTVAMAILTVLGSTGVTLSSLNSSTVSENAFAGPSPYLPAGISNAGKWFSSANVPSTARFLVLPNDYQTYNAMRTYLPQVQTVNIPYLGPTLNPDYNVSKFVSIMLLLQNDSMAAFAADLAVSHIGYVVLLSTEGETTLVPSYLGFGAVSMSYSILLHDFEVSSQFSRLYADPPVVVFSNLLSPTAYPALVHRVVQFVPAASSGKSSSNDLLSGGSFLNWSSYLSSDVTFLSSTEAILNVNGSSKVPFVVLYTDVPHQVFLSDPSNSSQGLFSSNSTKMSYNFASEFSVGAGELLHEWIYWYNSTTPSFYGYFEETTIGAFSPGDSAISASFTPPQAAVYGRIVLEATAQSRSTLSSSTVDFPTLVQTVAPSSFDSDASLQYMVCESETSPYRNPLCLLSPYSPLAVSGHLDGPTVASIISASAIDPNGSRVVSINLAKYYSPLGLVLDYSDVLQLGLIVYTGGASSGEIGVNGNLTQINCTSACLAQFNVTLPTDLMRIWIGSGVHWVAVAPMLTPSGSDLASGSVLSIAGPVGPVSIRVLTGSYSVSYSSPSSQSSESSPVESFLGYLPFCWGLTVLVVYLLLRLNRSSTNALAPRRGTL